MNSSKESRVRKLRAHDELDEDRIREILVTIADRDARLFTRVALEVVHSHLDKL